MELVNKSDEQIELEIKLKTEEKKIQELEQKDKPIHVWWKEKPWRP